MNKCPRCNNEKLKEEYNYCPICGADLEEVKVKLNKMRDIQLLREIKDSFENYECSNSVQKYHAINYSRALGNAIKELERSAQEVPVQEQSTIYVNLDENFSKEVIETISKLNKLLNQEYKTTTYQKI